MLCCALCVGFLWRPDHANVRVRCVCAPQVGRYSPLFYLSVYTTSLILPSLTRLRAGGHVLVPEHWNISNSRRSRAGGKYPRPWPKYITLQFTDRMTVTLLSMLPCRAAVLRHTQHASGLLLFPFRRRSLLILVQLGVVEYFAFLGGSPRDLHTRAVFMYLTLSARR